MMCLGLVGLYGKLLCFDGLGCFLMFVFGGCGVRCDVVYDELVGYRFIFGAYDWWKSVRVYSLC